MRRVLTVLMMSCAGSSSVVRPDVATIDDARAWTVANAESHAAVEAGKHVLRLAPIGGNHQGSNVAIAMVSGLTMERGSVDVDLRGRGETDASFLGIAFGVADASRYEAIYFRPFRFRSQDPVDRAHAVQYIAWPEHTWEALRKRAPGVYEAPIAPVPDPAGWFHARIEIDRTTVKVFIDHAVQPTLVVSRLRTVPGGIALWVDSQEGSFANLEVTAG
jgi:hypothetical protein